MKFGIAPLSVALMVMVSRLSGAEAAADLLALAYLVVITVTMSRNERLTAASRA